MLLFRWFDFLITAHISVLCFCFSTTRTPAAGESLKTKTRTHIFARYEQKFFVFTAASRCECVVLGAALKLYESHTHGGRRRMLFTFPRKVVKAYKRKQPELSFRSQSPAKPNNTICYQLNDCIT